MAACCIYFANRFAKRKRDKKKSYRIEHPTCKTKQKKRVGESNKHSSIHPRRIIRRRIASEKKKISAVIPVLHTLSPSEFINFPHCNIRTDIDKLPSFEIPWSLMCDAFMTCAYHGVAFTFALLNFVDDQKRLFIFDIFVKAVYKNHSYNNVFY